MNSENFITNKKLLQSQNLCPNIFFDRYGRKYSFNWIDNCPIDLVLSLRNADTVIQQMTKRNKITQEQHHKFIQVYSSLPRIDFMIRDDDANQYIAGVNVNLTNLGLELGKYIGNPDYLGRGVGLSMTHAFLDYLTKNFISFSPVMTIYARTLRLNSRNINLNMKLGFQIHKSIDSELILMKKVL